MNPAVLDFVAGDFDGQKGDPILRQVGYALMQSEDDADPGLLQQVIEKAQEWAEEIFNANALVQLADKMLREKRAAGSPESGHYAPKVGRAWEALRSFVHARTPQKVPLVDLRKQNFFQIQEIKQWLLNNHPKGLSWEEMKNVPLEEAVTPEKTLLKGPHEELGLKHDFPNLMGLKKYPRRYFSLLFENLPAWLGVEGDRGFKRFQDMVLSSIRHDPTVSIGVPGRTFGWVIYRDLGQGKIFIEEIQSDYFNLIGKTIKRVEQGLGGGEKNFNLPEQYSMANVWRRMKQDFGEANLIRWGDLLTKGVENYFEILLSAFLREMRGKEIWMSGREVVAAGEFEELTTGQDESGRGQVPTDYDSVPPKWGFKAEETTDQTGRTFKVWHKVNASFIAGIRGYLK